MKIEIIRVKRRYIFINIKQGKVKIKGCFFFHLYLLVKKSKLFYDSVKQKIDK